MLKRYVAQTDEDEDVIIIIIISNTKLKEISCLRFVSTTNIDDYSSGESTMAEDLLRMPRHYRRRNALAISSASINDSEVDLTGSIEMSANAPATMSLTKMGDDNRAVSCSDLRLEFRGKHRHSHVSGRVGIGGD